MKKQRVFKVMFTNQGKQYEIYARRVSSSELYGFIAVEEIVFGERTTLVVDPGEEQLKLEFSGVGTSHIPFHSVIRIDEVEREGKGKILQIAPADGAAPPVMMRPAGPDKG